MPKVRLDVLLTSRGLFPSREAARRAIMAGQVRRQTEILDKPGTFVQSDEVFDVALPAHQYVGRGGLKLERAVNQFDVEFKDRIVVDVGASTGGFTDCALKQGARQVYAVDVGYGQLDWKLRNDSRVVVLERTNFRHVNVDVFQPAPSLAVMDVSFISTRLLFPKLQEILQEPMDVVSLIKPQFEAGRGKVGKGGIVRDAFVHQEVLESLVHDVKTLGFACRGLDYSPIAGGNGNIEYLAWWQGASLDSTNIKDSWSTRIEEVVTAAWTVLKGESVEQLLARSRAWEEP
jgi:23S rRNA (cytidine1920-2'-O)/16S rRNA (cytidine1409-2'-O)-methyltransferase